MKKGMIAIAMAVFTYAGVNAQETSNGYEKGDVFISGAVGYSSQETGANESKSFQIAPQVGYFVSENIAVGAHLGYQNATSELAGVDTKDLDTYSVGVFGRYYFLPTDKFSIFGQLGVDYLYQDNNKADSSLDGIGVALAPGISYFVSDHFALEATVGLLGYSSVSPDGGESTDALDFGVNTNDIKLGVVYKF